MTNKDKLNDIQDYLDELRLDEFGDPLPNDIAYPNNPEAGAEAEARSESESEAGSGAPKQDALASPDLTEILDISGDLDMNMSTSTSTNMDVDSWDPSQGFNLDVNFKTETSDTDNTLDEVGNEGVSDNQLEPGENSGAPDATHDDGFTPIYEEQHPQASSKYKKISLPKMPERPAPSVQKRQITDSEFRIRERAARRLDFSMRYLGLSLMQISQFSTLAYNTVHSIHKAERSQSDRTALLLSMLLDVPTPWIKGVEGVQHPFNIISNAELELVELAMTRIAMHDLKYQIPQEMADTSYILKKAQATLNRIVTQTGITPGIAPEELVHRQHRILVYQGRTSYNKEIAHQFGDLNSTENLSHEQRMKIMQSLQAGHTINSAKMKRAVSTIRHLADLPGGDPYYIEWNRRTSVVLSPTNISNPFMEPGTTSPSATPVNVGVRMVDTLTKDEKEYYKAILGERLNHLITLNVGSVPMLASATGVSTPAVYKAVNGQVFPRFSILRAYALALNSSVSYLLGHVDAGSPWDPSELNIWRQERGLPPIDLKILGYQLAGGKPPSDTELM